MEKTIFDYLKSILFNKKKIDINIEDKSFIMFMVNRWISMYSPELCFYVNETSNKYNVNLFTNKEDQYNFLYYVMPKLPNRLIRFLTKPKKETTKIKKENTIDYVTEYANAFELSKREIEMYLADSK